jgi:NAD(P)H-flavin reductase
MYFYIATAGTFVVTLAFEGGQFLFRNGVLTNKMPAVEEIFKYPEGDKSSPFQVTILLQEPLEVKPPQHINIWIPSLGVRYLLQSHPFVVTSWTGKKQTSLELLIEPRHGWTKRLQSKAVTKTGHSGGLGRVLFTGPHGISVPVDEYEYVFMVASGYGIIPHLPLLERLIQGALAHEVRARRICLVWELEDIGES